MQRKIYIAGKITGLKEYKKKFLETEKRLTAEGNAVMNPSVLPPGFEHEEYMKICLAMIDACDTLFFLRDWRESKGARMEHAYASACGKKIIFEDGI